MRLTIQQALKQNSKTPPRKNVNSDLWFMNSCLLSNHINQSKVNNLQQNINVRRSMLLHYPETEKLRDEKHRKKVMSTVIEK